MHFEALSKVFFSLGVFALGLFSRRHDQSVSSESKMWESFHLLVLQTKLKFNFTGNKNLKSNFLKLHFEYVLTNYLVIQILMFGTGHAGCLRVLNGRKAKFSNLERRFCLDN